MFGFVAAYPNEAEQGGKAAVVPYNDLCRIRDIAKIVQS